jgi:hypothetical protein
VNPTVMRSSTEWHRQNSTARHCTARHSQQRSAQRHPAISWVEWQEGPGGRTNSSKLMRSHMRPWQRCLLSMAQGVHGECNCDLSAALQLACHLGALPLWELAILPCISTLLLCALAPQTSPHMPVLCGRQQGPHLLGSYIHKPQKGHCMGCQQAGCTASHSTANTRAQPIMSQPGLHGPDSPQPYPTPRGQRCPQSETSTVHQCSRSTIPLLSHVLALAMAAHGADGHAEGQHPEAHALVPSPHRTVHVLAAAP